MGCPCCTTEADAERALQRIERDHADLELLAKVRGHELLTFLVTFLRAKRPDCTGEYGVLIEDVIALLSPPSDAGAGRAGAQGATT